MNKWIREEMGSLWQRQECQVSLGLEPGALVFSSAICSFMEEATCRLGWEREEESFLKLEHLLKETDIMWSQSHEGRSMFGSMNQSCIWKP